ncbi:MAG: hypothetical protein JNK89_03940, partial [Saprospiraceae bacterium]|nr:hypothetical protein [Saprospiraceae bacterium]
MTDLLETKKTDVILEQDPTIPPHLDFQVLRQEGLGHIGRLSGKLWTDHNTHDPGITILEALCYALLDLGYRTQLPFEDLIARPPGSTGPDDNFLSPAQALTINPVTPTDYRKLLLEIPCVRNAWLEIAENQEVPLLVNLAQGELAALTNPGATFPIPDPVPNCSRDLIQPVSDKPEYTPGPFLHVHLNGLYRVLIEKEPWATDEQVRDAVRLLLSAHRNLCEDFLCVTLLSPIPFGICAEIELAPGVEPEKIYAEALRKLRAFIQPTPPLYTLQELLDKGKPIEEIFAGRPRLKNSFGFVDTAELENLPRRKSIRLSDLYQLLLGIEGVQTVRRLQLEGPSVPAVSPGAWLNEAAIPENAVPVFNLETTCIDFRNNAGIISYNREKVHKMLAAQKKSHLAANALDWTPTQGQ